MKLYLTRKPTVCIKFGEKLREGVQDISNGSYIQLIYKVKHLGNYINNLNTYDIDCNVKRSLFNGYLFLIAVVL